jgi:hypothetical protein
LIFDENKLESMDSIPAQCGFSVWTGFIRKNLNNIAIAFFMLIISHKYKKTGHQKNSNAPSF